MTLKGASVSPGAALLAAAAALVVVLGPTIGFVIQAREIQVTRRVKGFSLSICLLLLLAHIFRIAFWCGRRSLVSLPRRSPSMLTQHTVARGARGRGGGA